MDSITRVTRTFCFVTLVVLLYGCSGYKSANDESSDSGVAVVELDSIHTEHDISRDARMWADSIMDTMTVEEMAGQLIMPAVYADDSGNSIRLLRKYVSDSHVGGVVLLKGTAKAARAIADTLRKLPGAPPFIAIDAEWGLAMRLDSMPEFPRNGRIAMDADETLMFDYGHEVAMECREVGINMILGPVLDVLPSGRRRSGIGSRSFGRDAARAAKLGVAYAKGVESGGVISVAKHFPGHGSADADSHKRLPAVAKTREELYATDLLPFKEYMENGFSAIMMGHLYVPALDEREAPVTVSEKILKKMVREDMGFQGLIVTDAMNMAGAEGNDAADAIMAGADIVLAPTNTEEAAAILAEAVRAGKFDILDLRDRVRRVLFYKYMTARKGRETGIAGDRTEAERIIELLQ